MPAATPPEPPDPGKFIADHEAAKGRWKRQKVGEDPAVDPEQLLANPKNPRIHPSRQQKAMYAILARHGWVSDVIVNQRTGRVIDGHMRISLAITHGETVPVTYIDVPERVEDELVAVYDAIGSQAIIDPDLYSDLIENFEDPGPALAKLFEDMMPKAAADPTGGAADEGGEDDPLGSDIIYGMVGWSETKVRATGEEIGDLTTLHQRYRAENGGKDEGFVAWLIQAHLD